METVIVDAGPLVAYLKKDEPDHIWAVRQFQHFRQPLISCDAVLSEAFFLVRELPDGARQLLNLLERGLIISSFDSRTEITAISRLMQRYEEVPMSFADACLVRMAELHTTAYIFTLDSDFKIYRKNRRETIPLIFQL
jgi:predicted nucleic acid-binding protein